MLGQANCDNAMMQVTILAATTEGHQVKSFTMEPLPSKKSSREILLQTLDEVEKLLDIEDWWLRIGDEEFNFLFERVGQLIQELFLKTEYQNTFFENKGTYTFWP